MKFEGNPRPTLEPKAFNAYVRTVTRNEFYDFKRAAALLYKRFLSKQKNSGTKGRFSRYARLSRLPEAHQRAIQAVYLEGRTYEDAAEVTGIPLGSLKRYLRLGLGQLRSQLAGVIEGG
jgi:DNA-directed RNA polymerase specialized sigma24 family protein